MEHLEQQAAMDQQRFQDSAEIPRKPSLVFPTPARPSERPVSACIVHNPGPQVNQFPRKQDFQFHCVCVVLSLTPELLQTQVECITLEQA